MLVDPVWVDRFASGAVGWHPARRIDNATIGPVDAIVLTHGHLDHFHPESVAAIECTPDAPLIVPDDSWLIGECRRHGLPEPTVLAAWDDLDLGGLRLVATPSEFEMEEFGLVFESATARYWHMSDAIADRRVGERIRARHGPVDVVATRYQPGNVLVGYQRNLGASYDERDAVAEWLEAACATQPGLVFPYFCGVAYVGEHAWANRWSAPFAADEIAALLDRRLGGPGRSAVVSPGDVVVVGGDSPVVERQASPFVFTVPPSVPVASWEPVDASTLPGVDASEREGLARSFERWFAAVAGPWLRGAVADADSPMRALVEWDVVWQVVIHAGDGERIVYSVDFRVEPPVFRAAPHPHANYVVHLSGSALMRVLLGRGEADLFWMSGAARFYEKLLTVIDGQITAPPERGWALWERLPEPITLCLRKLGPGELTGPSS